MALGFGLMAQGVRFTVLGYRAVWVVEPVGLNLQNLESRFTVVRRGMLKD